jgi:glycosyltransferase 2 family protein
MKSVLGKWFVYLSLLFLIVALIRGDYLVVPSIRSPAAFALSVLLLFAGFLVECFPWGQMLRNARIDVSLRDSLVSIGISVFGKYIPGKVWSVIGRSAYIASRYGEPEADVALIAFNAQIMALWSGLLLGSVTLLSIPPTATVGAWILALWAVMTVLLFGDGANRLLSFVARVLSNRKMPFPPMGWRHAAAPLPLYFVQWLCWALGFLCFANALTRGGLPVFVGFSFALAATVGILALVVPGGIGVREAVLMACLSGAGLSVPEATTVAAASRLWFLLGETFMFLLSVWFVRPQPADSAEQDAENPP